MEADGLRRRARLSQADAEHQQTRMVSRGTDPDYIRELEHFEGFSHEEIYRHVQAMNPGDIQRAAEVWVGIADGMFGALTVLHSTVQAALAEGMEGHIADAAEAAARRFVRDATDIAEIAHSTGHRMIAAACGAEAVRKTVPPPMIHGSAHEREEQRLMALAALDANYAPIYPPAGSGVPAFFTVMTPGDGTTATDAPGQNGGGAGDSVPTAFARSAAERPAAPAITHWTDPADTPDAHKQLESTRAVSAPRGGQGVADTSTAGSNTGAPYAESRPDPTDIGTEPAALEPDADPLTLTPAGTPSPLGTPAAPAWPRANPASPDPGRSFPGPANLDSATPSRALGPTVPSGPGTGMPPGMFAPGGRSAGDSDSTHRTPDWLIRDRQEELLGSPLPYVPQTIGAEILAARNDLTFDDEDLP